MRYRDAMTALDAVLPDGVDVVVDAGNTGAAAIHHLPVRRGGRFLVALGMGGMGYSFGAGIGMAFARNTGRAPPGGWWWSRGRRVFYARHGGAHRCALPAAHHVRVVQQQRPRHVRDPRAALLRR
ncbi:acetolactate synthase domain protein [Mycobacterium xenopi 4042]|uniref:Acetolactate synthase domain protein n=1 Tax=Mycobacterium xenopi 4042 TaxID=1299334 RepID=X7YHS1_MYCXE|nr:acetolactate synthase domain protein [Mycobacterium xenopi 4042]